MIRNSKRTTEKLVKRLRSKHEQITQTPYKALQAVCLQKVSNLHVSGNRLEKMSKSPHWVRHQQKDSQIWAHIWSL